MTVTKRKQRDDENAAPAIESGTKASCDSCATDITYCVHVRCAERNNGGHLTCPDFDLCIPCFLAGKALGPHRATHAYRIIYSHAFPIFDREWGADEELLLIEGAELYGLGNWADIAEHVGGRTKEDCEQHYNATYIDSPDYPFPIISDDLGDTESFQARKRKRLEELQAQPLAMPPPKPMASAPTCHEIGGFMPGRLEFETEYENEAETMIKDLEFARVYDFGGDSQPQAPKVVQEPVVEHKDMGDKSTKDGKEKEEVEEVVDRLYEVDENLTELELKLTLMEIFNERYDRRVAAKDLIWDRGLINYKTLVANERKRSKEERDLIQRTKVFARIQTAMDHERFVNGLMYEMMLRKRILKLQDYRKNGITTQSEAERFEAAKSARASAKAASYRDSLALFEKRQPKTHIKIPRQPSPELTLANSQSLHLLDPLEQKLCSTLRMLPRPYLYLKETLLREWARRNGNMGTKEARMALVNPKETDTIIPSGDWGDKIERVWEFLVDSFDLGGRIQSDRKDASLEVNGIIEEGNEPNGEDKMDVSRTVKEEEELADSLVIGSKSASVEVVAMVQVKEEERI